MYLCEGQINSWTYTEDDHSRAAIRTAIAETALDMTGQGQQNRLGHVKLVLGLNHLRCLRSLRSLFLLLLLILLLFRLVVPVLGLLDLLHRFLYTVLYWQVDNHRIGCHWGPSAL